MWTGHFACTDLLPTPHNLSVTTHVYLYLFVSIGTVPKFSNHTVVCVCVHVWDNILYMMYRTGIYVRRLYSKNQLSSDTCTVQYNTTSCNIVYVSKNNFPLHITPLIH